MLGPQRVQNAFVCKFGRTCNTPSGIQAGIVVNFNAPTGICHLLGTVGGLHHKMMTDAPGARGCHKSHLQKVKHGLDIFLTGAHAYGPWVGYMHTYLPSAYELGKTPGAIREG